MYRNLINSVGKFKLSANYQRLAAYHTGSSFYGYRPKPKREWKSMQKIIIFYCPHTHAGVYDSYNKVYTDDSRPMLFIYFFTFDTG